ncbi:MAG: DUF11 domain-containing protein, partial [Thermoanaerobaculum sp.]|nr:DUF11 domain-containing protein [Thermoanaerobaculum sp.]
MNRKKIHAFPALFIFFILGQGRGQAQTPQVTLGGTGSVPIGATFTLSVTFANSGSAPGYGPYVDLFLPLSGADGLSGGGPNDGISFAGASYFGAPVTANVLPCPAGSSVTHPLTSLQVTCPSQPPGLYAPFVWQFVVLTLPFGSFVPTQPPAPLAVQLSLHNFADLGTALPVHVRGGFRFGADPLDNPGTDPPIQGSLLSSQVTPTLLQIAKAYNGPEDETATGPNFPRSYTVTVSLAPGQTVTNLLVTDTVPANIQFLSLVSTNPSATCTLPSTAVPGGTLTCTFASVTGSATMVWSFFGPLNDSSGNPVINPSTGDDVPACNNASAVGNWTPLDPRDTGGVGNAVANPAGCEHTLTLKSIAVQKSVGVVGGGSPAPGKVLEYTLTFQVSDFFAFGNVVLTDVISDGQRFDPSFPPTLSFQGSGGFTFSGTFSPVHYDVNCHYTGGGPECETNTGPFNGSTDLVFRITNQLGSNLIGGCIPLGGTGGPPPSCSVFNDGPTQGTLTFRTIVQENFSDTFPSGDPSVDQNDVLNNTCSVVGDVLSVADASTPTGSNEADGSGASVSIPPGAVTKSIYALNGNTSLPPLVLVSPGDQVTYRVRYQLTTSDFEDLTVTDYLPLPIFDATQVTTFSNTVCGIPAAGASCLGPNDTYHLITGAVNPTMSTSAAGNSITWTYGDFDSSVNGPSTIDLLFTVTVTNQPFADGLFLTNQAYVVEGTTNSSGSNASGIIQVQLQEPYLVITKGAVWTDNPGGVFNPSTVGPVTFAPGCPAFSGTVTSAGLAANPVNSNLTNVDAGDQVMMAIVVENRGRNSAFDVRVRDSLPAGVTFVPGSLCVTDGTGAAISFTDLGGGLFGSGIELVDP